MQSPAEWCVRSECQQKRSYTFEEEVAAMHTGPGRLSTLRANVEGSKQVSRGILRWVALGAAVLAAGMAAGCGAGSKLASGGGFGPVPGETTQVTLVASSAGNDRLVRFGLTLNSLSLTNEAGTSVPVISTPQQVEFMHLNGSAEPLLTVSVPQDVYTSATATVGGASFTCAAQNPSDDSDTTATYAYGATPNSQVTVHLPEPLTVDGITMALSLEMLVSPSASFPSTCYYSGIAQYSITPTFNLAAMTLAAEPTDPTNGKLVALEGLWASAGAEAGSFTLAAADGSPLGTTMKTTWSVKTNSSTAYQGIGSAGGLTAGMAVDLDGMLQADGSVLATRVAVPDADTTNLVVNTGPLMLVASSVPVLNQVNREAEGSLEFIDGWPVYNFGNAKFATWGGILNVASLPFPASFDAANMVPGQLVAITSHVTAVGRYPTYAPATVVTLMPQTINGTVLAEGTAGAFTTYTVGLQPYDLFPQFAVQGGQTTLLTNPMQVVVYADQNTQMANSGSQTVGSVLQFTGVIFNNNGTLRMDCIRVAEGVTK
jgi:hypothetical protein